MDKGTCPESLQYRAKAQIRADNDFKTDIKRIRKNSEQEVVNKAFVDNCVNETYELNLQNDQLVELLEVK